MSEQLRESLSAVMDGETDAFELRRVLDEARQDEALREQWHRFHLIRDFMRDEVKCYHPQLRDSIRQQLHHPQEDDAHVTELVVARETVEDKLPRSPWLGRVAGTAVAAAVAVVILVSGGVFDSGPQTADFAGAEPVPEDSTVAPVLYTQATDQDKQRQNALILHHIQQRAMNQAGVASFVKMATFNSTRVAPVRPVDGERVVDAQTP